ncbi:MAG TPA: DUF3352 domain-containing protein [Blastocatellia bacterium]|nr:DUF3352 domain-containing protein [Blastocatellia bacterium]
MTFRKRLTRKNLLIAGPVLATVLIAGAYVVLRRPPRVDMARYAPATALAFVEVRNVADLVTGLTDTDAWEEIAPLLGISSQLGQVGFASDLISRAGVGPDEAVIAGRAQYALVLTAFEAETGASEDGSFLRLSPSLALVIETHSDPEDARRLVRERAVLLAQRVYGEAAVESVEDYDGTELRIFQGPRPDRQLVAAASGSVIVIANHTRVIKPCLDAVSGRAPTLAENRTLRENRPAVDHNSSIFAFVSEAGVQKLVEFGPAVFASRITTDPDRLGSLARMFGQLSKETIEGALYGYEFASGGAVERYLTVLRPRVAESLADPFRKSSDPTFDSLRLVPGGVRDFTILSVDRAGELPERVLKQLSPNVDVVAGLAFREFVLNFRKQLGLEPGESIGDAVGNEITLLKFDDAEPTAMIVRVTDKERIRPVVEKYLRHDDSAVSEEGYKGTAISLSSNEDGRAAALVGDYLALGTRDQIARLVDAASGGANLASDERMKRLMAERPANSSVISYKPEEREVGELMLAVSKITRTTDGSPDLLEQDRIKAALDDLKPSVSFTEFRSSGVYTEVRSPVGSLTLLSSLVGE